MCILLLIGCLNGGGQIKPKPGQSGKDLIQSLEAKYTEKVCFGSLSDCVLVLVWVCTNGNYLFQTFFCFWWHEVKHIKK